jgi:hypothetical protein
MPSAMKIKTNILGVVLVCLGSALCHAQDFSANVVYFEVPRTAGAKSPQAPSKLYVSKDKIRLQTYGFTDAILLVNGAEHSTVALYPSRKIYQQLAGASQYFRVENAGDACADWQKASDQRIACEKVGEEEVNGRHTVQYLNKNAKGASTSAVWVDADLRFVVKWETATTGAELREIKEEKLSSEMFIVPDEYKPMKPQKGSSKGFSPR